jgi:signal transduction histidine kinase
MKIRTRLTVWYAAILVASLLLMGFGAYVEISEQLQKRHKAEPSEKAFDEVGEMVLQIGIPAVIMGLLGGWWLTRKTLKPIITLTKAIEELSDSNLKSRLIQSGNRDELDRLTEVYNDMTERLDASFMRIREFTLHASHELKTPLTVMRGELETGLASNDWKPEMKDLFIRQIEEIERLAKIVDGLTLLTKADAGQVKLDIVPIRLDELLMENLADTRILAQPMGLSIELVSCEPMVISGDRHRLRQLLLNLSDNAVKYNVQGGKLTLSLRKENQNAIFQITNSGKGLAVELQPRVFERFFRGDASHSRNTDGCGLGLSIAQWIVQAHGGSIGFVSVPGGETTVTVKLPLKVE